MTRKVPCIMLIDDNESDNYYHELVIRRNNSAETIVIRESAEAALEYLRNNACTNYLNPDIIFLDINMPGMNGWQFLEEYQRLGKELQGKVIVVMLTACERPEDRNKEAGQDSIIKYKTKPLTTAMLNEVYDRHFLKEAIV